MAAVEAHVVAGHQWRGLEPCGRGHELLGTWALYRRGGDRTHSPTGSGYLKEPLDKAHDSEPEFVLAIDRILAGLFRAGYEHAVEIVKRFYLSDTVIWRIARDLHRTEGFVRLTLRGVCEMVEQRVSE